MNCTVSPNSRRSHHEQRGGPRLNSNHISKIALVEGNRNQTDSGPRAMHIYDQAVFQRHQEIKRQVIEVRSVKSQHDQRGKKHKLRYASQLPADSTVESLSCYAPISSRNLDNSLN